MLGFRHEPTDTPGRQCRPARSREAERVEPPSPAPLRAIVHDGLSPQIGHEAQDSGTREGPHHLQARFPEQLGANLGYGLSSHERHDLPLSESQEASVEGHPFLVEGLAGPAPVECRALAALWGLWIGDAAASVGTGERRKAGKLPPPSFRYSGPQVGTQVAEEQKRLTGSPFLPHEE